MTDESVCELCGGTGRYVQSIAYENEHEPGVVREGVSNILCHGCNGSGKQRARLARLASDGELADAVLEAIKRLHETPGACLLAWCDAPGTVWVMKEERGGKMSALFCERHAADISAAGE